MSGSVVVDWGNGRPFDPEFSSARTLSIDKENWLRRRFSAKNASFDPYEHQHLLNIESDMLERISPWTDGENQKCRFWMSAMDCTEDSTIARTVTSRSEGRVRHALQISHAQPSDSTFTPPSTGRSNTKPAHMFTVPFAIRPRSCFVIIALFAVFVVLSLSLGVYFTLKKEYGYSMGDSFTLGGYVVALGTTISAPILAYHYPHCKCWEKYEKSNTHIEMEPLIHR